MELYPYPRFSLKERDRRWRVVRQKMAEQNLSVIVVPANTGHSTDFQANARYLSHCGGGGDADITVIFPLDGAVTVGATSAAPRWPTVQDWVDDIREARRDYGKVVLARLHELNVDGTRIGVTGLGRGTRTPEGTILFQTMRRMMRDFPNATFVDATPILDAVRLIKSDEEIDCLTKSNRLVDEAFLAEKHAARAGALDYVVWAEATAAMLRGGSELPVHCNWVSGPCPPRTLTRPSHRILERGDIILNELESSWIGYRAQGVQPICVETCDPAYVELMKVQGAIFHSMLEMLKPGVTVGELSETCRSLCESERPQRGPAAGAEAQLIMHGRGQGDDGPIITNTAKDPYQLQKTLQAGMVCIFKPEVHLANRTHPINWGDTVLVTERGGKRLGEREHGIWIA